MTSSNRSRDRLRALAAETVEAVQTSSYEADGRRVDIARQVADAVDGTRLVLPDTPLTAGTAWSGATTVEVRHESSLAARRLGRRPCSTATASSSRPASRSSRTTTAPCSPTPTPSPS